MNWKKIRRRARRFVRRHRRHLTLLCAVAMIALILGLLFASGPDYDDFREALGMRESSGSYDAVNRFGYMGKYQMGSLALREAGFMDEAGAWTDLAGSYGIDSQADFLASPAGQDAAVEAYHARICHYIHALELDEYVGRTYCGVQVTKSGLVAACHLVGIHAMNKALASGQPVYDGNRVAASEYMELFSGYNISRVWNQ